jgi:hypothetical protein
MGTSGHGGGRIPPGQGLDVVLPEGSGPFALGRLSVRRDIPDGRHGQRMDTADLSERDELAVRPCLKLDAAPVHPIRSVRITPDLHVLAQLLVAHGASLGKEELDLLQHERVALDRCRVVRFLKPDPAPDALRLERRGEPAQPLAQLADLDVQALVDRDP